MTGRDQAMERAQRRARQLREFYGHLAIYVLVCAFLVVIDLVTGSSGSTVLGLDWAYWPLTGWGVAVAIHAISVNFAKASTWEERKAEELYEEERQRESLLH